MMLVRCRPTAAARAWALVAAIGALGSAGAGAAVADDRWPAEVKAHYRISFAGFDIGRFDFSSEVRGKDYTLQSSAELSVLLGAFKWKGSTRSSGDLAGGRDPKPQGYTFDYRSNKKSGSVKLGFNGNRIANVSLVPPNDPHPDNVPVQAKHLKDVLDPLTAVLSVTRYEAGNPCARRLQIFDGKQRFDLVFSFRRQEKTTDKAGGQAAIGYVCRVRYVPVAGYRMNKETRYMASNDGIEVGLRPVPEANLLIPYRVTIPTIAGEAVMTSKRIEIVTSEKKQIALVY